MTRKVLLNLNEIMVIQEVNRLLGDLAYLIKKEDQAIVNKFDDMCRHHDYFETQPEN